MDEPFDLDAVNALVAWAVAQDVARGTMQIFPLPPSLERYSTEGRAYVATTRDGRHCALLKTEIGYKDNFKGLLACDAPLHPEELIAEVPRPYLTFPGLEIFEELYVRSRIDDRTFSVFFDLN